MYLFFDTETTGIPKDYKASYKDVENWPRIVQFAWAAYNSEGRCYKKYSSLIKPDGWEVPNIRSYLDQGLPLEEAMQKSEFWVINNLSQSQCLKEGRLIAGSLFQFCEALDECQFLIAHNMSFDFNVVAAEMQRIGIKAKTKPEKICTMMKSINIVKSPYPSGRGGFKFPKLAELHQYLFNCDFDGAHDAGFDVAATAKCFFELKRRKLI